MITLALATILATSAATPADTETKLDCSYDLEAMLDLDLNAFDQDLNGGWRMLANKGCILEAAELISKWRFEKRSHDHILYWHEGQLRARNSQTKEAVALFNLTYKSVDEDKEFGWNHYVDGTIAFLTNDRERLDLAVQRLKDLPKPADADQEVVLADGNKFTFSWPPNLNVLTGFQKCWGKAYEEAYGRNCGKSFKVEKQD